MLRLSLVGPLVIAIVASMAARAPRAEACGCFAPPTPAQPVIQAGEQIVFGFREDRVVAHVRVEYEGSAEDFAWLVPVPSDPEVRVGTEELFVALDRATAPTVELRSSGGFCGSGCGLAGCGDDDGVFFPGERGGPPLDPEPEPVLLRAASAGPYDYALVRADRQAPMVAWLRDNGYAVPAGSDDALAPYIRPGAMFLALKLRSGESTGALQPVVLEYPAERASIPLVLTSVGATEDMPVQVWVLGPSRAVPVNYAHVELNEEHLSWLGGPDSYLEVVGRALDEAEGGRGFVTEFAGRHQLRFALDGGRRFPDREGLLRLARDLSALHAQLIRSNWPWPLVQEVLARHYPLPPVGIPAETYYARLPELAAQHDPDRPFDAEAIIADVWERIVEPTRDAQRLLSEAPRLTRLLSVLSPHEMTEDPSFAFNPDLPDVDPQRTATLVQTCETNPAFILELSDGRTYDLDDPSDWADVDRSARPFARRVEAHRIEGPPQTLVDNDELLWSLSDGGGGCRVFALGGRNAAFNLLVMFALVGAGRRRLRRARRRG